MAKLTTEQTLQGVHDWTKEKIREVVEGENIPALAENLEAWADQKAIATPDTYTDAVRTTGGDIPIETSAGSKLESIKPVAGSRWKAKMLFNGSYNMLNAAKWGAANSQPYVGGVGSNFVYFLVPELTLGTFGAADENNGLLFTNSEGENVQPADVYFEPLGSTVPQSLTDGTSITPTSVSYDGNTFKVYETPSAGWLIVPKTIYDNDVCAHIAWEDWYDKHVSLNEPNTNPEAVLGILMLEGLLALAHSDKYLLGVNDEVCDNVVFGDTSATITHMVDEINIAANAWTNAATGESDSQGNDLYRHSATVSGIKNGGAACVEGEDGGIPLTVNGTTVSYIDTNATAPASVVFYQIPTEEETTKSYSDSVFSGSNINQETGVLPINDCSIEAQVGMEGEANITVKYAKNIVDQVAINAATDVPKLQEQVEEHEERITELEDTAVRTGSYDASVAVGLADNFKGDTIVDAEFYKRKTGGTQSVGSGIAAIKEVRGKSLVWNQLVTMLSGDWKHSNGSVEMSVTDSVITLTVSVSNNNTLSQIISFVVGHKYLIYGLFNPSATTQVRAFYSGAAMPQETITATANVWNKLEYIATASFSYNSLLLYYDVDKVLEGETMQVKKVQVIDLTLMFGAGNEPATIAEVKKMFPLDYYDYNEGEIIPFAGQNLVTTGKNQYNPATGKANLLGGQTYQIGGTYTSATIDEVAVTLDSNDCFTTTKDCVLDVTGGNDTDTFVSFYNGETNAYEPYERHSLPLDPSQWRDKNGELVFPYGGMHGVGTAYDYAKVDADGYIRRVVRCFEQVNLGSFDWRGSVIQLSLKNKGSWTAINAISTKYPVVSYNNRSTDVLYAHPTLQLLYFTTSQGSTADAMQGVMFTYELAEPVEVELATPVYAKYLVDQNGTEEITPANGQEPYTTPANISILYAMDARGEIKNLPKNYLSKESAENMLNAMVSAGIIASYTMTWDSTNSRYAFVITKPVEENQS